jgi:formylglycine-generating enzyme required for sulfatase activity
MQRRTRWLSTLQMAVSVNLMCCLAASACSRGRERAQSQDSTVGSPAAASFKRFADCADHTLCPEMTVLPSGSYVMGSPASEPGRFEDEPQSSVAVSGFAIGTYLVTRGQWRAFATATKRTTDSTAVCAYAMRRNATWEDVGFPQTDEHPVVCITWPEAHEYARWLSIRTGHVYRLLTQEEWEYAARGGTTTAFPWGELASHERANYGKDSCCSPDTMGRDRWMFTSPVGSFAPNAFGLYDMQGNVFEWIETCADSLEVVPIPPGVTGCSYRYARGGVYGDRPTLVRSAAKNFAPPPGDKMTIANYRSAGFGLRVARELK